MNPDWTLRDALLKMLLTFLRLRFDLSKTLLVLKRKQKRDQANSKALKLYFQSFLVVSQATGTSRFFSEQPHWLPLVELVIFFAKIKASCISWILPSPPLQSLPCLSLRVCTGGRAHADVKIKFSRIDRFPLCEGSVHWRNSTIDT